MSKHLFFLVGLGCSASLCFGQSNGLFETNAEGKIYFQRNQVDFPIGQNSNSFSPNELVLDWSGSDFNISENPTVDSWDVRLSVGQDNTPYVVYNDNHSSGLQKIMFRKKLSEEEWAEPIFVDTGGEIGARNNHFPAISTSPNGDLHVVYNVWAFENVRNFIGYSYYNAEMDEWSDGVKISDLNGTVSHFTSRHDIYSTEDNLPVVIWGYDFRENQINEEIYMTYFDGENWSSDIAVSDVTDGADAGYPYIKSIGDGKAMILYSENTSGGTTELKYRIYNESTHELSSPSVIVSENIGNSNYVLVSSGTGGVMVATIYKKTGPDRDAINVYVYDNSSDSFSLSDNSFEVAANAGSLLKRIAMDCNSLGECAIIYTDFLAQTNSYLEYYPETGFGDPLVINQENPGFDAPSAGFSPDGNLHVVWSDYRFDNGEGFDEREVFYEMGRNELMGTGELHFTDISIYPNPSKGVFIIQTKESFKVEIFNMAGKLMDRRTILGTTEIQKSLAAGVYLIRFTNEKGIFNKKLLVQ